jgi:hypothetical protein
MTRGWPEGPDGVWPAAADGGRLPRPSPRTSISAHPCFPYPIRPPGSKSGGRATFPGFAGKKGSGCPAEDAHARMPPVKGVAFSHSRHGRACPAQARHDVRFRVDISFPHYDVRVMFSLSLPNGERKDKNMDGFGIVKTRPRRLTAYARAVRQARIFARLRDGWAHDDIARDESLSTERVRQILSEALSRCPASDDETHIRLQVERLSPALRARARRSPTATPRRSGHSSRSSASSTAITQSPALGGPTGSSGWPRLRTPPGPSREGRPHSLQVFDQERLRIAKGRKWTLPNSLSPSRRHAVPQAAATRPRVQRISAEPSCVHGTAPGQETSAGRSGANSGKRHRGPKSNCSPLDGIRRIGPRRGGLGLLAEAAPPSESSKIRQLSSDGTRERRDFFPALRR